MKTKYVVIIFSVFFTTILLYIISEYSYPVFHMLIEFTTLFIGISIFITSLSANKISKNHLIARLSPGILVSTIIVFIHALAYEGMNFFVNYDANLSTQLWVLSNGMQVIVFFLAIVLIGRKVYFTLNIIIYSLIGIILTSLIFLRIFPDCYIVGSGLTNFKIYSEYLTILLYMFMIFILIKRGKKLKNDYFNDIIHMMIFFIIASFMFTQYGQAFVIQNFLGHMFRAIGLIILYNAVYVHSITKPLDTLFKKVNDEYQSSIFEYSEKTKLILDSTVECIFGVDIEGNCTFVNNSLIELLGFSENELLGKKMHDMIHHSYPDGSPFPLEECDLHNSLIFQKGTRKLEEYVFRKDGTSFFVEYFSNPQYKDGEKIGAVVSFNDISERIKYQQSLVDMSYIDNLTKLYNRRYYEKYIKNIEVEENYPITIVVSDINGLKFFNDSFGHSSGDTLLIKISQIFRKSIQENNLIARMGGDEFVFVLLRTNEEEAEVVINSIIEKTKHEKVNSLQISASYGYKTIYDKTEPIKGAYKKAEDNMYQEKLIVLSSIRSNATETILSTLYEKDPLSEIHSRNVSRICENMAISMGFNRGQIQELHTAGLLHDIGKIIIPTEILNKKGVLTVEEYDEIKKHSEIGFRILNSTRNMRKISLTILSHHEKWDGTGYPRGIKGDDIPLESRIISIADAYDAMTSKRTYREIISPIHALLELKNNSGTQFDPKLIEVFEKHFAFITSK